MSNTYFKIKENYPEFQGDEVSFIPNVTLSLTAFIGNGPTIQLSINRQNGANPSSSHIILNETEQMALVGAIMERVDGVVTATGSEKSVYTDPDFDEDLG